MLNKKLVKQLLSTFLAVCMVLSLVLTVIPGAFTANAVAESVLLAESEEANYEKLTFSDFGVANGEILNQGSGHYVSKVLEGDLDEVLFRGKFLFPTMEQGKQFGNIYIGKANWWGLTLSTDSQGNILVNATSTGSSIQNPAATNLTANSPVELRNNPDLELAFSVKYENKTATTTDMKIGVWINGVLQPGGYIVIKNATLSELTRCFHTYDIDANSSVSVASVTGDIGTTGILLKDSAENDYEKLTFSDFGVANGEILNQGSGHYVSKVLEGDLDEVLFRGKFLFPTMEQGKQFGNIYIGKANWWGLTLSTDSQGNILVNATSTGSSIQNPAATNLTANSPVELRNNPDLELAFSVKYENKTATTTDMKIGVWINGVLQPGGYIVIKNATLSELTRCFHTYDIDANSSVTVASVSETVIPEPQETLLSESVENDYEKLTFSDFGVADGEILNQGSGHYVSKVLEGDLDEVLFQGKFLFPTLESGKKFGNIYIGLANWWGLTLTQDNNGNILANVTSTGSSIENSASTNLTANSPVELRNNPDLELAFSIKYENKTATTTDMKIGVWINGVLQSGGYIIIKNAKLSELTRCFHTYDIDANSSVTVASVGGAIIPEPEEILLSESVENDYEKLTFGHFGVEDGEILTQNVGHVASNVLEGNLDEILFQGKYLFPSLEQSTKFGNIYLGLANYYGIALSQDSVGNIMLNVISTSTGKDTVENSSAANLTVNSPVELRNNQDLEIAISVKYENTTDTTTDLKIGVWINGVLQKGGYIYARNVALSDLIRCFHTTDVDANSTVTVTSVGEVPEPEKILLSESEEGKYEKLTFGHFGVKDGEILTQNVGHVVSTILDGDLDEILFQGKYLFPTLEQSAKFGNIYLGKANYYGIVLSQDGAGNIMLDVITSSTNKSAIENTSATNLTMNSPVELRNNQDLEIAISVKYENTTDTTTDLKIGVWINGVLQKGGYIYARNVALVDLIRCFHTTDVDVDSTVAVTSVGEVVEPEDVLLSDSVEASYEKLTLGNLGVSDGAILTQGSGHTVYPEQSGNLDNVLFTSKFLFPTLEESKKFGNIYLGKPNFYGIVITQDSVGNILLDVITSTTNGSAVENKAATNLTLNSPVELRGNSNLEIGISIKYENTTSTTTDLKIGVWINGVLQSGGYIYARNVALEDLTRCFHTTDVDANSSVAGESVGSWIVNTLPTDFAEITLSDGNIPDGNTVVYGGFTRIKSLNKTLFSTNVQFNKTGARIHLGTPGGGSDAYSGLGLRLEKNGTLVLGNELSSVAGKQTNELESIGLNFFVLDPSLAGMGDSFAEKNFLLQISTEFVDWDNGGEANDIKLGIFIDGILYCNSYIYIPNEAKTLGTGVNFNGVNEVDFARYSAVVLQELTTTDMGMKDGSYTAVIYGTANAETLNQTAITAYVTFGGNGAVAFGSAGKGIVYRYVGSNQVNISHIKADGTAVDIGEVEIPGGQAVELRTTFAFIKAGEEQTNLKLGVFVNGKLSNYKHFVVENVDPSVLTKSMSVMPSGSAMRIGANSYENLTLRDFIIADKTRTDFGGRFTGFEGANYNNTAVSAVLTFSDETKQKNDNCFYLGGKSWAGIRVELDASGKLAISFVHGDGVQMRLAQIAPEEVGMTTFQGKAFTYRVTFDIVETAKGQMDAIIGVYVNDILCKGKTLLVKNVDGNVLDRGIFTYVDKNGGSLTMKSTNTAVDFTIFGLTKDWENTLRIQ